MSVDPCTMTGKHVSYASWLLVPGKDVAVVPRVVVAFAMQHDALTRRKESVTILKCTDVNGRLCGKRDSSMTSVYLDDGARRVLDCRSRFEDGRQTGTVHGRAWVTATEGCSRRSQEYSGWVDGTLVAVGCDAEDNSQIDWSRYYRQPSHRRTPTLQLRRQTCWGRTAPHESSDGTTVAIDVLSDAHSTPPAMESLSQYQPLPVGRVFVASAHTRHRRTQ